MQWGKFGFGLDRIVRARPFGCHILAEFMKISYFLIIRLFITDCNLLLLVGLFCSTMEFLGFVLLVIVFILLYVCISNNSLEYKFRFTNIKRF